MTGVAAVPGFLFDSESISMFVLCRATALFRRIRFLLTLPPTFIQLRLESGGCCHHTRLQPRAKARSHCGAQRLGPVGVRMLRRRWPAQASRYENAAEPYCSRSAILRAPGVLA